MIANLNNFNKSVVAYFILFVFFNKLILFKKTKLFYNKDQFVRPFDVVSIVILGMLELSSRFQIRHNDCYNR